MEKFFEVLKWIPAFILLLIAIYLTVRMVTKAALNSWDEMKERQWKRRNLYSKLMEDYNEKEEKETEQSPFKKKVPIGSTKEENGNEPEQGTGRAA